MWCGMRRAHPCLGVAVVGACREKGGSFPSFWTRFLFCSPCMTRLLLFSLTAGQAFFSVTPIAQSDRLFTPAQGCQSPWRASGTVAAETPVPAKAQWRPRMGLNLTWDEKIIPPPLRNSLFGLRWTTHLTKRWRKIPPPHKPFSYNKNFHFRMKSKCR